MAKTKSRDARTVKQMLFDSEIDRLKQENQKRYLEGIHIALEYVRRFAVDWKQSAVIQYVDELKKSLTEQMSKPND